MTKIEWTDATWNPLAGCSVVSPGCTNCYAMRMAGTRLKNTPKYKGLTQDSKAGPVWTGEVRFDEDALTLPFRWRKPRMVFVNSMSDLFHEDVPDEWIDKIFAVMALCPQHTFQVLTKRPERMPEYLGPYAPDRIYRSMKEIMKDYPDQTCDWMAQRPGALRQYQANIEAAGRMEARRGTEARVVATRKIIGWPLPNVWLGTSVEDQTRADERIPHLLATPAAVRFLSVEPLLGPVVIPLWFLPGAQIPPPTPRIDWVIVGGESGPGARPMHPDWACSIRDQCDATGVPFFFKQFGEWTPVVGAVEVGRLGKTYRDCVTWSPDGSRVFDRSIRAAPGAGPTMVRVGKKAAGRTLDGRTWDEYPETP